ncbi:MAG: hypothetical protein HETSPECPRED_008272 [Heterodermia speciosa]|uniref:Uncharacterized protein n=1 Tax=Heterodermia speciosa TaxID=116794 RepID=A0A8H3ISU0_9LECA|nr:MAG: hypothetical protein HETSPECPRED_008272 [Heterodermia speciosa]
MAPSPEPSTTTQGPTAQSTTANHLKATTSKTMPSSVRDFSHGQADGARNPFRAVEIPSRDPGIPDPPRLETRLTDTLTNLLARLEQQMKDDEADTVQAVLDDLKEPIRKSIRTHSMRRLMTYLNDSGDQFIDILRDECRPYVLLDLRAELGPPVRVQVEAEFAHQREQKLAELAELDAEKERRAQAEAEFAGQREQKLAQLAELDAEIERKRSAVTTAPPVTVKDEQDEEPSSPIQIKKEAKDDPSSLFFDWDDQGHQNVDNRANDREDDTVPFPFSDPGDGEIIYPAENDVPSIHKDGDDDSSNPHVTKKTVDYSHSESDDSSTLEEPTIEEPTIGELIRDQRRAMSLPSDDNANDLLWISENIGMGETDQSSNYADQEDVGNGPVFGNSGESTDCSRQVDDTSSDQEPFVNDLELSGSSSHCGQEFDTNSDQEDVGRDLTFGDSDESTHHSRQEDDISSDQERDESGESPNHSRQAGETYTGQKDHRAGSRDFPIDIDSLYPSDNADVQLPPSKARQSNATRGSKRKAQAFWDDLDDPAEHDLDDPVEHGQLKVFKMEDGQIRRFRWFKRDTLPPPRNWRELLAKPRADTSTRHGDNNHHNHVEDPPNTQTISTAGYEKKVNKTQPTASTPKTDAVRTGRVKKSMPKKKIIKRSLSRGPQVNIKEEEEDEEL